MGLIPVIPVCNKSEWKINNPKLRDFRIWEVGRSWEKIALENTENGLYKINAPNDNGYTASLVEFVFYPVNQEFYR